MRSTRSVVVRFLCSMAAAVALAAGGASGAGLTLASEVPWTGPTPPVEAPHSVLASEVPWTEPEHRPESPWTVLASEVPWTAPMSPGLDGGTANGDQSSEVPWT
ncbi:hypothetical protein ACGFRB_14570 [Streptomyces sp. NPDC048718]|uniref:hypothetical protein n=1 Tax=Streptomyces sp. NPDC048718 TaxID=3365587 RepID=UPI0037148178